MDLPDCPPGAEGYEDSVVEIAKKPEPGDSSKCTKAEQEFQDHLNSLKIRLENGEARCMVERRGRDISGKWIYLCYPCGSVCSGESILQTHISGKKHKIKLSMRNTWPMSIFDDHPFNQNQKGNQATNTATENVLKKMAAEVEIQTQAPSELENKFNKHRSGTCHIQDTLDKLKAPLLGLEYLLEHPPEKVHYEPSYLCTLCTKQGHPRTIINHLTCFWHRYNYLTRHFPKACHRLAPYKNNNKYREGVSCIMHRLAQRIQDKFGRLRPINIEKDDYERDKEAILQWIFKSNHFSELSGTTLEEVVDIDLLESLAKSGEENKKIVGPAAIGPAAVAVVRKRDPSPPVVAAPAKPLYVARKERRERRISMESLSDISDDDLKRGASDTRQRGDTKANRERHERKAHAAPENFRSRHRVATPPEDREDRYPQRQRPANYEYKVKLVEEKRATATEAAASMLAYHEKNPEKHPLYPEEWKKFWNRRYKEIQGEGKDPSKHDFKPEWIVFWTKRMKELHEEELQQQLTELYRRMNLPAPDLKLERQEPKQQKKPSEAKLQSPEHRRRVPEPRKRSPEPRRRSPEPRRRSPESRRSPEIRRRSPVWDHPRRRSPEDRGRDGRRRSPIVRRQSPDLRHRSPPRRPDYRQERRILPDPRYSLDHRKPNVELHHSSPPRKRTRSRSPIPREHSPPRAHIMLESARRSRSPLSRREAELRNRSPAPAQRNRSPVPRSRSPAPAPAPRRELHLPHPLRNRSCSPQHAHPRASALSPARRRDVAPSLQTVLISDDELKPDDVSPWNSDNDLDSVISLPQSRAGSLVSSHISSSRRHMSSHRHFQQPQDLGPPENIVATLRVLVALEDYLGSLGPKIVDLLTEALRMEKERANSSEELLEREAAVVLVETAKEKLKGAAQAGLVASAAAPALRAAIVRAAATLHAADTRMRRRPPPPDQKAVPPKAESVPVAGVGEVDRAQIAQQMAAALIAQGKTDVTSEELAQLVDAVVGMAEAKKRVAEANKKVEAKSAPPPVEQPPASTASAAMLSGTATALQMLQSAYDENDKKPEREDAIDAMDGLSDSDLETLLKNFNELSAEEQHSLIAYLKKLEAREPQRVERLRQYVSAAANTVTTVPPSEETTTMKDDVKPVTIESDDDDYTVEEVFQSATQKVKEDQIRKELDVVKKSLETKEKAKEVAPKQINTVTKIDLTKHVSSASDLFALIQDSIKSTAAVSAPADNMQTIEVLSSSQPRSFGDMPESMKPQNSFQSNQPTQAVMEARDSHFKGHDELMRPSNNQNYQNENFNSIEHDPFEQDQPWNQEQANNMSDNRVPTPAWDQGSNNDGGQMQYRDSGPNQFGQGNNKGHNPGANQFDQGPNLDSSQFVHAHNQGPNQFKQGSHSSPNLGPNQFRQGPSSGPNQFGQGPSSGPNQFGKGPNSSSNQYDQQGNSGPNHYGQGANPVPNQYGQGPNSGSNQFSHGPNSGPNQFGPNLSSNQFDQRTNSVPNQFGQGPNSGPNQYGQDNNGWQGNNGQDDNWQPPNQYNQGQNQFNRGRGNMHGRIGNNFGGRPQPFDNMNMNQQQFGIPDSQNNNFRGRGGGGGRGYFGGRGRGRGRF